MLGSPWKAPDACKERKQGENGNPALYLRVVATLVACISVGVVVVDGVAQSDDT